MKILAINSSPRKSKGATDIILDTFLEGVKSVGGGFKKIYLHDKKIKKCIGCFGCWSKTPGKCIFQNDDMPSILKMMEESDIIVFATPIYHFGMTSDMKIMIEKTLPQLEPFLVKDKELTNHTIRNKTKKEKWVIISVCGFPEIETFQSFDLSFQQMARVYQAEIIGKIYRPSSEILTKGNTYLLKTYLKNCYSAGQETILNGKISIKTQNKLFNDYVLPKFMYRFIANRFWKKTIKNETV